MDKLIKEINDCFLALHSGNKDHFEKFDIVTLKNQLENNSRYLESEFMLLRKSFADLFENNREKLNRYKTRISIPTTENVQKPEHEVIFDIHEWVGRPNEPYFEQYIELLKLNGNVLQTDDRNENFITYLKDDFAEKVCFLLRNELKDGVPSEKAKWIFVLYKKGLFSPVKVPDEKALFAKNTSFTYRSFYKSLQDLTLTKSDQEKGIKEQTKSLFDKWNSKSLPAENDPDLKGYFDKINKILVE